MVPILLGLFLVLLTSILVAFAVAIYHNGYWKRRGIDGPQPIPFVGNMKEWWGNTSMFKLREWTKKYGKVYGIQEGWNNVLVVSDLEMLQELFFKKFEHFHGRKVPAIVGNIDKDARIHVFNARGARWKRLRTIANPIFSVNSLKKILPIINDSARIMLEFLDKEYEKGKSFNIPPFFDELTMDVICRAALGQRGNKQFHNPTVNIVNRIFRSISKSSLIQLSYMFPLLGQLIKRFEQATWGIRKDPFGEIIRGCQAEVERRKKAMEEGIERKSRNVDFIDLFLEAEGEVIYEDQDKTFHRASLKVTKQMTVDEIVMQCFLFINGGYETTANALAVTCHYLACNPGAQKRLQQEIDDICPEGEPTYEQLHQLKYGGAVMKEVLRLQPIASFASARTCSETTTLGPYTVEAGTVVQADAFSIHYDKEIWGENAYEFKPERWLEESKERSALAWFPFGLGPRTCIGMRLAILEEKLALLYILRKYNLVRTNETEKELNMIATTPVLHPESVTIKLELRQQS